MNNAHRILDGMVKGLYVGLFLAVFFGIPIVWTYYKFQECVGVGHSGWYCTGVHIFGG